MLEIVKRWLDWNQKIIDTSETRLTVMIDDPPPEFPDFLEENFAKHFNFLVLETNSDEIRQFFDAIEEKSGVAQYLRGSPTKRDGTKRIVLACPTDGQTDYPVVLSGHWSIITQDKRFRKQRKKFPATTFLTIIGFNVEKESGLRKTVGAINEVLREMKGKKKLIMCYQDGHMWYLVIGANKSTVG